MAEIINEQIARVMQMKDNTISWNKANPILLDGEIGFEVMQDGCIGVKVGDGKTAWNSLRYVTRTIAEIDAELNSLQAQINNIVTAEVEGESPEVAQARVAADGTTFSTLKDRLDANDEATAALSEQADANFADTKRDLLLYNSANLFSYFATYKDGVTKNIAGVTYTWNEDYTECTAVGTSTGTGGMNIYSNPSQLPDCFELGKTYQVEYQTTDNHIELEIGLYLDGATSGAESHRFKSSGEITIPENCTGMFARIRVYKGYTVDGKATKIVMLNASTNKMLSDEIKTLSERFDTIPNPLCVLSGSKSILPDESDLNTQRENRVWLINSSYSYYNLPIGTRAGFLTVLTVGNWTYQELSEFSTAKVWKRRGIASGSTWSDWILISGEGGTTNNFTNDYKFSEYFNTYNMTVYPQITADTNNYLASTGDTTDVTASIVAMLTQNGICRLGAGVYYVNGVDMPDDTAIIGSGTATEIVLLGDDTTEGYAIKMGSRCTIRDVSIKGNTNDYTSNDSVYSADAAYVARHGILWQGNASSDNNDNPRRGVISGCYISNFTGGGITCYDSGLNVISGMNVSDCFIWHCYAGINIEYFSEFSRWTNVSSNLCYYGAINNGGNQTFSNCNFSKNIVGMLIDNSTKQSRNDSHGTICNCTFDHSDGNNGVGIKLLGVTNGELFSNCQLFYSSIVVDNCKGVTFTNFDYGRGSESQGTITVTNGSFVMFDKFMCRNVPVITVDDTSNAIVTNCYTWSGTAINI